VLPAERKQSADALCEHGLRDLLEAGDICAREEVIRHTVFLRGGSNLFVDAAHDVLQTVIDFVLVAFCIFLLVKGINRLHRQKDEAPATPAPKCPYCLEEIKEGATRCPHCAAELTVKK